MERSEAWNGPPRNEALGRRSELMESAAAIAAVIGFLVITAFQAALVIGAPWGRAAWGGRYERLPTRLRIGSGVAVVVWIVAAVLVLGRAGFDVSPFPDAVERWGTWVVFGLLAIGTLFNLASSSRWERFLWAPVAAFIAAMTLIVALDQ